MKFLRVVEDLIAQNYGEFFFIIDREMNNSLTTKWANYFLSGVDFAEERKQWKCNRLALILLHICVFLYNNFVFG